MQEKKKSRTSPAMQEKKERARHGTLWILLVTREHLDPDKGFDENCHREITIDVLSSACWSKKKTIVNGQLLLQRAVEVQQGESE